MNTQINRWLSVTISTLFVLATFVAAFIAFEQTAQAQSNCAPLQSNFGSLTYSVENGDSTTRTYNVWSRVKSPDGNPSYSLSLSSPSGSLCNQTVSGFGSSDQWIWVRSTGTLTWGAGNLFVEAAGNKAGVGLDCIVIHEDFNFTPSTAADCEGSANTDTQAPSVNITSPSNGQTVSGDVAVAATATDNQAVANVEFRIDGQTVRTDTTSPYSYNWNTATVSNGNHTVAAVATDTSGNQSTSTITVNVSNQVEPPPPGQGYLGEFWNVDALNGGFAEFPTRAADASRVDQAINFDWGEASPIPGVIGVDNFVARWTQTFELDAGIYRFDARVDDGIRIIVDGQTIMDNWFRQSPTNYSVEHTLGAGQHTIVVEYYEDWFGAVAEFSFVKIGDIVTNNPPSTVTGLSATAQSDSSVDLSWNPSSDPESDVINYRVERRSGSGSYIVAGEVGSTNFTDGSLQSETQYTYRVIAYESNTADRLEAAPSGAVSVTTLPPVCQEVTFTEIIGAISDFTNGTFRPSVSARFDDNGDQELSFSEIIGAISEFTNGGSCGGN